ncbi:MAG TPA: methionyl-tRNA formyltransferase [Candidatus Paceibacterota bacterium]
MNNIKFAFFGTSHIAVYVLDALIDAGLSPALVVAPPDKPQSRGLAPAPVAVSLRARELNIPLAHDWQEFESGAWDVAIVVDYGKILPRAVLGIPRRGFLNVHPSLLPRLRGASPMRSAILTNERETGVTIIQIDEQMDHGPIVAQKRVAIPAWSDQLTDQGGLARRSLVEGGPPHLADMERILVQEGGKLLAEMLPLWTHGEIVALEQNHDVATYTEKFTKEDGLLDLHADAYQNLLKIRAFEGWPGTYAFFEVRGKKTRVKILDAHIANDALVIERVVPEGKREMPYQDFLQSGAVYSA